MLSTNSVKKNSTLKTAIWLLSSICLLVLLVIHVLQPFASQTSEGNEWLFLTFVLALSTVVNGYLGWRSYKNS